MRLQIILRVTSLLCIFPALYITSPKQSLTTREFITSFDYPVQEHLIHTIDGYILSAYRISHTADQSRPAVLLLHGLTHSSDAWVPGPPPTGLPYMLADQGYDVWVGNQRGNTYARQHKTLGTSDSQFWDFSFHEIGCYDLAAMMDHIRSNTSQASLHYIGYSQGTTALFALLATRPTYAKFLKSTHLLATVVYIQRMKLQFASIGNLFVDVLIAASRLWGYGEVLQFTQSSLYIQLCNFACSETSWLKFGCATIFRMITGLGSKHLNETFTIYQQLTPPLYDLTSISTCVNLYYSNNDFFSAAEKVEYLAGVLPCAELHRIPHEDWNHYDFLWSHRAKEALYDRIIRKIELYEQEVLTKQNTAAV